MTVPPAADHSVDDRDRLRRLRRAKALAGGLLVVAALIFILTLRVPQPAPWVGFLRAGAEASMIGALADWFAVTALFRHPLGLPIPHTAIIPQRKDALGDSLGAFVQQNFLARAVVLGKLRSLGLAGRLGEWLASPVNARRLGESAGVAVGGLDEVLRDEDLHAAVEQILVHRVRAVPAAPIVARLVEIALDGGHHQVLLDMAMRGLSSFLEDNRDALRAQLGRQSPWWVPESLDDVVFDKGLHLLHDFLAEMVADPAHELRGRYDTRLRELARRLRTDPEMAARAEAAKEELLAHPAVRGWTASLGAEIKRSVTAAAADADSELRRRFELGVVSLGGRLRVEASLQAKVDGWFERIVGYLVDSYRAELADLVAGTVRSWDAEHTSRKIELQVGRDLQWIRVNGTVVGGLAGLVIYAVAQLITR
ncbi:MAG: DUF445 domain-containing protein [Actinobacteria bacterium]|nr:DUF445 domain-containing protein [Actinomycetota bacterium]MBI3687480.1 DUF445 domain-containing protein [Actinomycetota bacterium]